jgi:hypothetical protein
MHYFSSCRGTIMDTTKSVPGHMTPNLCFPKQCDLQVT